MIIEKDSRELLIYAFRYALGRSTYSTSTVSDAIIRHWPDLSDSDKVIYKQEIEEAIENNCAGMDCDIQNWKKIMRLK